jgi:hypothetical protein
MLSSFILPPSSLLPSPCGERRARARAAFCHDLRHDGEGHFFRRDRADVQSDGRSDLTQDGFIRCTVGAQTIEHDIRATLAADQADIIWTGRNDGPQSFLVLIVAARHDGDRDAAPLPDRLRDSRRPCSCDT